MESPVTVQHFLDSVQQTALGQWVSASDSLWAYPTVLTLHTIGLGMLVGANAVIDFRLLGVAREIPIAALRKAFRPLWIGFWINAVSGIALFAGAASRKGTQPIFFVKLALIAVALIVVGVIRANVFGDQPPPEMAIPAKAKVLAWLSLVLWVAAIAAGRLMAYM
jgi:hypothetical protein